MKQIPYFNKIFLKIFRFYTEITSPEHFSKPRKKYEKRKKRKGSRVN